MQLQIKRNNSKDHIKFKCVRLLHADGIAQLNLQLM